MRGCDTEKKTWEVDSLSVWTNTQGIDTLDVLIVAWSRMHDRIATVRAKRLLSYVKPEWTSRSIVKWFR